MAILSKLFRQIVPQAPAVLFRLDDHPNFYFMSVNYIILFMKFFYILLNQKILIKYFKTFCLKFIQSNTIFVDKIFYY